MFSWIIESRGFKHGVFATAFSVRAAFNWMLKRIVWSEPQVDAEMHLKQYCRHLSSVDRVLHSFFGACMKTAYCIVSYFQLCFSVGTVC